MRKLRLALAALLVLVPLGALRAQDSAPAENDAERIARAIEKKVEAIRGHRFTKEVKIGVYSRDELLEVVREKVGKELARPEALAEARAFRALGLLPADYDLAKGALEFLSAQIAGFYDPEAKELFLIKETNAAQGELMQQMGMTDEVVVFHELVHALQDQVFGLEDYLGDASANLDIAQARKTLVEGDATFNMIRLDENPMLRLNYQMMPSSKKRIAGMMAMAEQMGMDEEALAGQDAMLNAPAVLVVPTLFDYADGYRFVAKLVGPADENGAYDLSRLDAAFRDPPRSTEQILHPEKYLGEERDDPTEVTLPDLAPVLGAGWSKISENTLGELLVRTWLEEYDTRRASRVHRGWDGDRFAVWGREGAPDLLVWSSVWDSEKDAREFADAAVAIVAKKTGVEALETTRPWLHRVDREGLTSAVMVRGARVVLVEKVPTPRFEALLLDLWLN
ncbi:MAG: hypothetical protein R3F20_15135 [Planctomycetota bacterium]